MSYVTKRNSGMVFYLNKKLAVTVKPPLLFYVNDKGQSALNIEFKINHKRSAWKYTYSYEEKYSR